MARLVWLIVLVVCAVVHANTEIYTFGPHLCARHKVGALVDTSRLSVSWPSMSPAPTPKRFMITPGTTGAWVALFPDYNDFEQAVHKYELKITWLQTLLLQIPDRMRWMLTQRYQLRLSWPANALHKQKQAPVDEGPLQPCELLFAKISAVSTGTRLRVDELASSAHWLLHLAEHLGGWAAPLRRDAQDIPVDVTFERVYLGCIPQSTLPLILYLCIATVAASLLSTRVLRIVAHATRPTK